MEHDIAKAGYQKIDVGSQSASDITVEGGYVGKQAVASKIHSIGKHLASSQFYSGAPGEEGGEAKDHSPAMEAKEQAKYTK